MKKATRAMLNELQITFVDSPELAPNYNLMDPMPHGVILERAIVVGNGTVDGRATVDLILFDEAGRQYVAMCTGRIVQMLAAFIEAKEKQREEQQQQTKH